MGKGNGYYFQCFILTVIGLVFFYLFKFQKQTILSSQLWIVFYNKVHANEKVPGLNPTRETQSENPPPNSLPKVGPKPAPNLPPDGHSLESPKPSSPLTEGRKPASKEPKTFPPPDGTVNEEGPIVKEGNTLLPTSEIRFLLEPFIYDDSLDRRDPFVSYEIKEETMGVSLSEVPKMESLPPLRRFDLSEFSLKGVLWDVKNPLAMFEDPRRVTHFVKAQDPIGNKNGHVAAIREGEVLVVEYSLIRGVKKSEVKRITLDTDIKNQGNRSSNF